MPSSCLGEIDELSLHISPHKLNANLISDIKAVKSSHQLSFHRRVGETNPRMF